jgi:general secretion pathway protein I
VSALLFLPRGAAKSPAPTARGLNHARGFTLLEVLIAFTIAAIAFTALMRVFSTALDVTERAGGISQATLIAQSKLAQVGTVIPLVDGGQAGDEVNGRFRWSVNIGPYEPPVVVNPDAPVSLAPLTLPLEMKRIEAVVRYGEPERNVTLVTYRSVAKKQ